MHFISKRAVVLGVVAALGFAGTAQAATDDTSVTLTGGTIALAPPTFGDFPGATLDGSADSQSASVSGWGVNDPRGSGLAGRSRWPPRRSTHRAVARRSR